MFAKGFCQPSRGASPPQEQSACSEAMPALAKVRLSGLTGDEVAVLELPLTETVGQIKRFLATQRFVLPIQQKLLFQSEILDDCTCISTLLGRNGGEEPLPLTLILLQFSSTASGHLVGAASWGSAKSVKSFLKDMADPNVVDEAGRTALHAAVEARQGHAEIVWALCGSRANVNQKDRRRGRTPLYMAAHGGHLEAASSLCDAAADPNSADNTGMTPLAAAANVPSRDLVRLLCDFRASLDDAVGPRCETVLFIAARRGCAETVKFLCESGASLEKAQTSGVTPLHVAAAAGHWSVVRSLCKVRACPDRAELTRGTTPLLSAAEQGHVKVVEALCASRAQKDQASLDGVTPLHVAVQMGNSPVAQMLCRAGAQRNKANAQGITPLHIASAMGHEELVRFLCLEKAEPNRRDKRRNATPLLIACEKGHASAARALCLAGADQALATNSGKTYNAPHMGKHHANPSWIERVLFLMGSEVRD